MTESGWEQLLLDDLDKLVSLSSAEQAVPPAGVTLKTGERRFVTVLFLDMKGFTTLSEKLDHEMVDAFIGKLFIVFKNHIETRGGWVEKFEGDAIMAAFGAKVTHEDDAARAVDSGIAILQTFEGLQPTLKSLDLQTGVRIGIHSGEVTRSKRGSDDVITGDTVNVAARLEQNAATNTILVSADTRRLAGGRFDYRDRGKVEARGRSVLVESFVVAGRSPAARRWERTPVGARSGFAGRRRELALLNELYRKCFDRRAPAGPAAPASRAPHILVSVEGDPGIGKSRLIHEFLSQAATRENSGAAGSSRVDFTILKGGASSFSSRSYELPASMMMRLAGAQAPDQNVKERFEALVSDAASYLPGGEKLRKCIPLLGFVMGLSYEDSRLEFLEPKKLQMEILIAFRTLAEALAEKAFREHQRPLTIVCEDYHWVDEPSHAVIEFVASNAQTPLPLFFLVCRRPGALLPRAPERSAMIVNIELHPFSRDEEICLIRNILGEGEVESDCIDLILERSTGNPYFSEELVSHLLQSGGITRQGGTWRIESTLRSTDVPVHLRSLILSRIDSLPLATKTTLQNASVLGREFYPHALEWIHGRVANMPGTGAHLDELVAFSFLLPPPLPGEAYAFKHSLMRDVVYETVLHYNRRILHGLYAEYIETHYAANLEPHYYDLAENWLAAGQQEKAIDFYLKAGEFAQRFYDNNTALSAYSRVLELLSEDDLRKCRSLRERGTVNQFVGRTAAAREDYERSLAMASELQSREEECLSSYSLGAFHVAQSRHKEAAALLEVALAASREVGDRVREGAVLFCMGLMAQDRNEFGLAMHYYEEALRMSRETGDRRREAEILNQIGLVCHIQTRLSEAFRCFQEALDISKEIGDRLGAAASYEKIGRYYFSNLLHEKAHAYFEQALEIKKETGDRKGEADLVHEMGLNYYIQYRYREAMTCYETALAFAKDSGYRSIEAGLLLSIGELNKQLGRYEEALQNYLCALDLDRENPMGATRTQVVVSVGVVLRFMGQYGEALRYLEQGLQETQGIGSEVARAWTLDNMGELYKDLGDYDKALELFLAVREHSGEIGDQPRLILDSRAGRHIGEIRMNQGRYDEAFQLFSEALDCARRTTYFNAECESLFCVGTLHYLRSRFQEALALCREAASIYEKLGVDYRALPIRSMEARILAGLGNTEAAHGVSVPVVQWLRDNPSAVFYRDLRAEQIFFTHYLILKGAGSPDCRDYLDRAHRILHRHTAMISKEEHCAQVLGEPLNRLIVQAWREASEAEQ